MPHVESIEDLVDDQVVSAKVGVPTATLAQWRYMKKGPRFIKVGRHVRYRPRDVNAWLEQQTVGGDAA